MTHRTTGTAGSQPPHCVARTAGQTLSSLAQRFVAGRCIVGLLLLAGIAATVQADNWTNWRGPGANGVVSGQYPVQWSADTNLAWKTPTISPSGSTPAVWNERIFVTGAANDKNLVRCLDWDTGKEIWRQEIGDEVKGKHRYGTGSNPSPVTDGQLVFVYYKSGDLAALDFDGNVVWHLNLQDRYAEDTLWWDLGTSPVLTRDYLVVAVVQSGPSYLLALDPSSGEVAWKTDRMLDAPEESNQTYSTPSVVHVDGQELIVTLGADHVTAHRATDGQEVWRVGGLNPERDGYFRSIASPVVTNGIVIAPYARGKTITAITLEGDVMWRDDEISSDVPTPAAVDGKVYLCTDKGRVACLDAKTGNLLWEIRTPRHRSKFKSSPVLAGDKLYVGREDGTVFVFDTSEEPKLIATNEMEAVMVATPVFVKGRILIRTNSQLYCVGG